MGDIADQILDGSMCQWCGAMLSGDGFPTVCAGCQSEHDCDEFGEKRSKAENRRRHPNNTKAPRTIVCGLDGSDLFGEERRTVSAGYAADPGTGPTGKTCGDCAYFWRKCLGSRTVFKCGIGRVSQSELTDIRKGAAACRLFDPAPPS